MSLTLVIDTSLWGCTLGLWDKKLSWVRQDIIANGSDLKIQSFLEEALAEHSIKVEDIKRILVSSGPGSFTGVRVAIAWVYGFIEAGTDASFAPYSSLEMACRYLQQKHSLSSLRLLLPLSRFELIEAHLNDNVCSFSTCSVRDKQQLKDLKSVWDEKTGFLLRSTRAMAKSYEDLGFSGTQLTEHELSDASWQATQGFLSSCDPQIFGRKKIDINYIKASSAEENLKKANKA